MVEVDALLALDAVAVAVGVVAPDPLRLDLLVGGIAVETPAPDRLVASFLYLRSGSVAGKGDRTRPLLAPRSDCVREFGRGGDESVRGIDLGAEFVVTAAEVLDERMPPC